MNSARFLKTSLIASWFVGVVWGLSGIAARPASAEVFANQPEPAARAGAPQEYVGSEACQACHETESTTFSRTAHSRAFPLMKAKNRMAVSPTKAFSQPICRRSRRHLKYSRGEVPT